MQQSVRMYTLSTCVHCKATKRFFDSCAVRYEFTDVDLIPENERKAVLADVMKLNPECSFPTIIIGDTVIVGFQEEKIKAALGLA
jgi:glutaredoxin